MSVHILFKVISLGLLCLSLALATTRDEVTQDFIEHVLRIPNPDRVLNSVLGRLEKNQQGRIKIPKKSYNDADCEDPEGMPEYTESLSSQDRDMRQLGQQKHYPICHLERKIHRLNTNEYEYRPAYYEEVLCTMSSRDDIGSTNEVSRLTDTGRKLHFGRTYEERWAKAPKAPHDAWSCGCKMVCSSLGFSCVQWNKTIHLTRRRYTSDCWETRTMVIPAGCECMWPVHRLGDISLHV